MAGEAHRATVFQNLQAVAGTMQWCQNVRATLESWGAGVPLTEMDDHQTQLELFALAGVQQQVGLESVLASVKPHFWQKAWKEHKRLLESARSTVMSLMEMVAQIHRQLAAASGDDSPIKAPMQIVANELIGVRHIHVYKTSAWIHSTFPSDHYTLASGTLLTVPTVAEMPPRKTEQSLLPIKEQLAQAALLMLNVAYTVSESLQIAHISLFQARCDPKTGNIVIPCVLSIRAERSQYSLINIDRVDPLQALENFGLRMARDLSPIHPYPLLGVTHSYGAADNGPPLDLNTIDPLDFEKLVRTLLERMGYIATLTKASNDGGVDIEAINPAPITGGKMIVQCKRYSSTIGSPFVRELLGTVTHHGATKGVLITTSRFSQEARDFAASKPLELIDRQQLEALLAQYSLFS